MDRATFVPNLVKCCKTMIINIFSQIPIILEEIKSGRNFLKSLEFPIQKWEKVSHEPYQPMSLFQIEKFSAAIRWGEGSDKPE